MGSNIEQSISENNDFSEMASIVEQSILKNYDFSEMTNLKKESLGGLMNENYTFISSGKKYFVKVYKYYPESKIKMSHALIEHISTRGIKTCRPVRNREGDTLCKENDILFEISEFITDATNRLEGTVSEKVIKEMAVVLAGYHNAVGDCNIKLDFVDVFSSDETKGNFLKIERMLSSRASMDSFDELCLNMVRMKIDNIKKIPQILREIDFDKLKTLINHGDFLTGNCLFDSNDTLKYVIDFEHAVKTYRVWDIIKTSAFLARKNKHEIFHSEINIDTLINFIKIYHSQNPLEREEAMALPELYVVASILSDFVLYGYYLAGNEKAKNVASLDRKEWSWWIDNRDSVKSRLGEALTDIEMVAKVI